MAHSEAEAEADLEERTAGILQLEIVFDASLLLCYQTL